MSDITLSAGIILRQLLSQAQSVSGKVTKIFPVVIDDAKLPYIAYRRVKLEYEPTKQTQGALTVIVEVNCYSATYESGIQLAGAVIDALCYKQGEFDGVRLRACHLTDAEEYYENDAFVQSLTFKMKLNK